MFAVSDRSTGRGTRRLRNSARAARAEAPRFKQPSPPPLPDAVQEAIALLDLDATGRPVRAGHELVSEGRRAAVSLILDGIAIRYRILRDGQRQILDLLLPGDFAGIVASRFASAPFTIRTLTPATVATVPLPRLVALLDANPHLAARLFWQAACGTAVLGERLIGVGRRPARERVAHFLLELLVRLQTVGLAGERSYRLPLTQEMIADALGLSVPYLNRVLHELRAEGLVGIKDQVVEVGDIEELTALADFDPNYLRPLAVGDLAPLGAG